MWKEYYTRAKKYDDKKLIEIFGDFLRQQHGVGVLSTFIIGDEIEVATQYLYDEEGYCFALDIREESVLDVGRAKRATGTTVKIHMNDYAADYFIREFNRNEWLDWYHFDDPEITIKLDGNLLKREYILDAGNPKCCWHKAPDTCFDELIWSFTPKFLTTDHWGREYYEDWGYEIVLNGIHIVRFLNPFETDQRYNNYWSMHSQYGFAMHMPKISVKDKANRYIKTDLARTNVTAFRLELDFVRIIYKYFIVQLLRREFDLRDRESAWFYFHKLNFCHAAFMRYCLTGRDMKYVKIRWRWRIIWESPA